jgi:hypothetical protein
MRMGSSSLSIAATGTRIRRPIRIAGSWPVRTYSYADVRETPSIAAASSTDIVRRSATMFVCKLSSCVRLLTGLLRRVRPRTKRAWRAITMQLNRLRSRGGNERWPPDSGASHCPLLATGSLVGVCSWGAEHVVVASHSSSAARRQRLELHVARAV